MSDGFGRVKCGTCGKSIKFPIEKEGKIAKCPNCGEQMRLVDLAPKPIESRVQDAAQPPMPPPISANLPVAIQHAPIGPSDSFKQEFVGKKTAAGIFAILLFGALGSHKFYLGLNKGGTIMAITSAVGILGACFFFPIVLIAAMSTIALIEGVIYLTKNEDQFFEDYAVRKKQWF